MEQGAWDMEQGEYKLSNCKIIEIHQGRTKNPLWNMAEPFDFTLQACEHLAIVGANGAGKSMLVDILVGNHPLFPDMATYHFPDSSSNLISDNIKYITFRDTYGGDNDRTYYLQQRWNQMEIDDSTPTVGKLLDEAYRITGDDTEDRRQFREHLYDIFNMRYLLDKYIILLSSGELRKFMLCRTLMCDPRVLIMDNPFIGLDKETREQLKEVMKKVSSERDLQIILVLAKNSDIPDFITHVVPVKDMVVQPKVTYAEYMQSIEGIRYDDPARYDAIGKEKSTGPTLSR